MIYCLIRNKALHRLSLQTNTSLFSVFCPHSHAYRETSR